MAGFLLGSAAGFALDREHVRAVVDAAAQRRDSMLANMVRQPYPPAGAWHYEDFALAAYWLNQRLDDANQAILTDREKEFQAMLKTNDFHWHAYLLERIYFLFNSKSPFFPCRMSAAAESALLDMLWRWAAPACRMEMTLPERDWWMWGSENHHAQAWSGFWGAAEIFLGSPDYKNRRYADGSTPAQMADAFTRYFQRTACERAARGLLVEGNSAYNKYTLGGWYNMADFAADPLLRQRMKMLLDLFWADWAIEQIDGIRGGSRHRCYPGRTSIEGSSVEEVAWYHFGLSTGPHPHPNVMCAATTFYRPALLVADLALNAADRGTYAYVSRRPGLALPQKPARAVNFVADPAHPFYVPGGVYVLDPEAGGVARYSWCTPDFVMGTSMVEARPQSDWTNISSQNRWEGVIFGGDRAGDRLSRIFVQSLNPPRGSVYNSNWSVENKGVMIVQRLKASNAKGQLVWFAPTLRRTEQRGWIFVEAPRAYAAVRVVQGETAWEPDFVEQHREGGKPEAGMWLKCVDEFSPVILEVARKSDFKSLADFEASILANPIEWAGAGAKLDYRSQFYQTALTLYADYSRPPEVDGKPVDYRPRAVYDSPFIRSDFGSGVVRIRKGREEIVLDFNSSASASLSSRPLARKR